MKKCHNTGWIACLLLAAAGCSTPRTDFPRIINEPAPLPADVRASFGRIGVMPPSPGTNVHFHPPVGRAETFARVTETTFDKMDNGVHVGSAEDLAGAAIYFGLIGTISATAGAVAAATVGVSDKEFQRCDETLRAALFQEPIPAGIQKSLADSLSRARVTNAMVLPESDLIKVNWTGETADYSALAKDGIDSVLDIRISEVGFELRGGFNPNVSFAPKIAVLLIRVTDGKILHAGYLDYRGSKRPFTEWAEADAKRFRKEMRVAERKFARAICEQYFSDR